MNDSSAQVYVIPYRQNSQHAILPSMSPEEIFTHSPEEIEAQALLQTCTTRIDTDHMVPEVERLLAEDLIPEGGIATYDAASFEIASPGGNEETISRTRELLQLGLFDPAFSVSSRKDREEKGKAVAGIASAIVIGKVMDRIYQHASDKTDPDAFIHIRKRIWTELSIPDRPQPYTDPQYLMHAEKVLLVFLREMLCQNIKTVCAEIANFPSAHPQNILLNQITKVAQFDGFTSAYEFLARGVISDTNHLYALVQYIASQGPDALQNLALVKQQQGNLTREQALTIFHSSKAALHKGLAKNDVDILKMLAPEQGGVGKMPDGILTIGQYVDPRNGQYAPFLYRPENLTIIPTDNLDHIGIVVLRPGIVAHVLKEAEKQAFAHQQLHHTDIRPQPRLVTGCPARSRRFAPIGTKKPGAIKYIHDELATQTLQCLNERYATKSKQ